MKTEIAIIGGGFAGLNLVKHLAEDEDFHITLVDVNNYHFFPPLLYQVATGIPGRSQYRLSLPEIIPREGKHSVPIGQIAKDHA